jgi:hypothetical protein
VSMLVKSGSRGRHVARRRHRRRRIRRLSVTVTVIVLAVVGLVVVLSREGSPSRPTARVPAKLPTHIVVPTTTTTQILTTTTTDVGALPQTESLPSSADPAFIAEMAALWAAIESGSSSVGQSAFFPESAYVQLKTIASPQSDYTSRLVANFDSDIAAAHSLLGSDPGSAGLVSVDVPQQNAHWVPVGVCDNRVGYYEVANARVVYEQAGQTQSFGIASLISWRGIWYVVHLGAILRSGSQGEVDDPESGSGVSAPSSTC